MTAAYVQEFEVCGVKTASVVIDQEEFDRFVDELAGITAVNEGGQPADSVALDKIRAAKHLPLMTRGAETEKFFQRWGVKCARMGVITRGQGRVIAAELFRRN